MVSVDLQKIVVFLNISAGIARFHKGIFKHPNACGPQQTPENYKCAVEILQSEGQQNLEGITSESIFNLLNYFNVCVPGLPPWLGNDIFEGILSYDLALYLKYLIKQKKWFTYSILNRHIKQFKYSASDV